MGRTVSTLCLGVSLALGLPLGPAVAQEYPVRAIKLVVPVPPGGPLDLTARVLADGLRERLKQPVIVENKPGAGTLLATQSVARSDPDGDTLLLASAGIGTYTSFVKDPQVDVLKDLEMVSVVASLPYVIAASNKSNLKTIADLRTVAKGNPDKLNYGTYGNHNLLATAIFNQAADVRATRIPFSGSAPAHTSLITGDIDYILTDIGTLGPLLADNKVTLLAVCSPARIPGYESTPTLRESGVDIADLAVWYGLVAPAKTPAAVIERLNRDVVEVGKSQAMKDRLAALKILPVTSSPAALRDLLQREQASFSRTAASLKIVPE